MYYDLDDILAVQQKVPCRFNCTVPGLGYLEGNPGRALEANTKVDLPFWLASVLNTILAQDDSSQDDYTFLDIEDPEFINTKVLNAIRASATTIDLHKIAQHYYNLVIRWCTMYSQDDLVTAGGRDQQLCLQRQQAGAQRVPLLARRVGEKALQNYLRVQQRHARVAPRMSN